MSLISFSFLYSNQSCCAAPIRGWRVLPHPGAKHRSEKRSLVTLRWQTLG